MKKNLSNILLLLVFITGLSLLLYPGISDYINSKNQSRAVAAYNASAGRMSEQDYTDTFAQAEDYNRRLYETDAAFYQPGLVEGYSDCLSINGGDIMGYVSIDRIKVELPIYHGTSPEVLNAACGHLEGSSLPCGGANTHCVLSAHRGLPSAKLFTDLDELEVGDTFSLSVLNRVMYYKIDQILIVEPEEVDELQIVPGKDYCTLFTCTPYGINTHRLLVRGERMSAEASAPRIIVSSDAHMIDPLIVTPIVAAPVLLLLLIWLLFSPKKRERNRHE